MDDLQIWCFCTVKLLLYVGRDMTDLEAAAAAGFAGTRLQTCGRQFPCFNPRLLLIILPPLSVSHIHGGHDSGRLYRGSGTMRTLM